MMDDEHSFTWPADYHEPALHVDHRNDNDSYSSVKDQTPDQVQIKPEQLAEIDEYNEPEPETS